MLNSYRGFEIREKRDVSGDCIAIGAFGHRIKTGYIAVRNGCLGLPGGGWSEDIAGLRECIDIILDVVEPQFSKNDPGYTDAYYVELKRRAISKARAAEMALLVADLLADHPMLATTLHGERLSAIVTEIADKCDFRRRVIENTGAEFF